MFVASLGAGMKVSPKEMPLEVTLVEMLDQILAPLDRECAHLVEEHLNDSKEISP